MPSLSSDLVLIVLIGFFVFAITVVISPHGTSTIGILFSGRQHRFILHIRHNHHNHWLCKKYSQALIPMDTRKKLCVVLHSV